MVRAIKGLREGARGGEGEEGRERRGGRGGEGEEGRERRGGKGGQEVGRARDTRGHTYS